MTLTSIAGSTSKVSTKAPFHQWHPGISHLLIIESIPPSPPSTKYHLLPEVTKLAQFSFVLICNYQYYGLLVAKCGIVHFPSSVTIQHWKLICKITSRKLLHVLMLLHPSPTHHPLPIPTHRQMHLCTYQHNHYNHKQAVCLKPDLLLLFTTSWHMQQFWPHQGLNVKYSCYDEGGIW